VRTGGQRLDDVAAVANAAIGDDRHLGRRGAGQDRRNLRNPRPGYDARGTDRARSDAHLDRVGAGVGQVLDALRGRDIAAMISIAHCLRRALTVSMTASLCPWAVSRTSTSTSAAMSCAARS